MSNTGKKIVTRLRLFKDGLATSKTKPNVEGDKYYVAPFEDLVDCNPLGPPAPIPTPTPAPVAVPATTCAYTYSCSGAYAFAYAYTYYHIFLHCA